MRIPDTIGQNFPEVDPLDCSECLYSGFVAEELPFPSHAKQINESSFPTPEFKGCS